MKKLLLKTLTTIFIFGLLFFSMPKPSFAAASFGISGTRTLNAGQNITVTISANRNVAYNAVSLTASFSGFSYVSSGTTSGWTTVSGPSRSGNSVSYAGALLGQSVTGARNVITLTLKAPSTPGTASISVSGQTSGDGVGTGIESGSGSASFTIKAAPTAAPATPTPLPAPNAPAISSSTHSDQNAWYKNTSVSLSWNQDSGVSDFSYILDQNPTTNPDDASEGTATSTNVEISSEGTSYFHIKAKNSAGWGAAAHFKINIDKNTPEPFTITAVKDSSNNQYRIYFATNEKTSSIASYEVFVDGTSIGNKTSDFTLPLSTKEVKVIATDNAGNLSESILKLDDNTSTATTTGTITKVETVVKQDNTWIIALSIALLFALIYAGVMTYLYLKGGGKFLKPAEVLANAKKQDKSTDIDTSIKSPLR